MPVHLKQAKVLAEQLSPEDRLLLWRHIATLIGLGIRIERVSPSGDARVVQEFPSESGDWEIVYSEARVEAILKGRVIFQIEYHPENFIPSHTELIVSENKAAPQRLIDQIHAIYEKHDRPRPSDEWINERWRQTGLQITSAESERISNELVSQLPDLTWIFVNAIVDLIKIRLQKSEYGRSKYRTSSRCLARTGNGLR